MNGESVTRIMVANQIKTPAFEVPAINTFFIYFTNTYLLSVLFGVSLACGTAECTVNTGVGLQDDRIDDLRLQSFSFLFNMPLKDYPRLSFTLMWLVPLQRAYKLDALSLLIIQLSDKKTTRSFFISLYFV